MNTPPTRPRLPLDLRIVAFLFLLSGIYGWIYLFANNTEPYVALVFGILCIPVFFGLLQLRAGWRKCAAILNAIVLISMIGLIFSCFFNSVGTFYYFNLLGKPLIAISKASFLTIACGWLILFIWIQVVLAKSKPLFQTPENAANRHLLSIPAGRVLKWTIILAILSYVGIFVNNSLKTTLGRETWYVLAGKSKSTDPHYFQTATIAFRKLLEENGFQRTKEQPIPNFGIVSLPSQSKNDSLAECFSGSYKGSPKFTVFITPQNAGSICINYSCDYLFKDYTWRVRADEKKVKGFSVLVSHWWKNYQKLHPLNKIAG